MGVYRGGGGSENRYNHLNICLINKIHLLHVKALLVNRKSQLFLILIIFWSENHYIL